MAMKRYSTFPKAPGLEPHHQFVYILYRTLVKAERNLTPLQRCSRFILLPQLTGLLIFMSLTTRLFIFYTGHFLSARRRLTPLQKYSQCILQPLPSGPFIIVYYCLNANCKLVKLSSFSRGRPECFLFNSYYTEV